MYTYTDAKGEEQTMSREEAQAIEASGRNSLEKYTRMSFTPFSKTFAKALVKAMHDRDNQVEVGIHPVEGKWVPRLERGAPSKVFVKHRWHLRAQIPGTHNSTACKRAAANADVFGYRRFTRLLTHANVCRNCFRAYLEERNSPTGRQHIIDGRPM